MPASKIPSPEMNTKRIYYRDENNVSKPFGWISDDHSLILLDEGEVRITQSINIYKIMSLIIRNIDLKCVKSANCLNSPMLAG